MGIRLKQMIRMVIDSAKEELKQKQEEKVLCQRCKEKEIVIVCPDLCQKCEDEYQQERLERKK